MKKSLPDKILLTIWLFIALFVLANCHLKTKQDLKLKEYPKNDIFLIEEAQADYCANSPECYVTDENGEMLTFNLTPPEIVSKWQIHKVTMLNHSAFQNEVMRYAYQISNNKDFLYTLKAECGNIEINCLGDNGHSRGFCQIHDYFYPEIISDPRFSDWKWQIDTCYRLYKGGTRFYGYDVRHKVKHHFKFYDN